MARRLILCVALALVGCSDHRYGFFGDEDGATTGFPDPDPTDGREPGPGPTSAPTSSDPPGPPDPSGPVTVTSSEPDPTGAPGLCGEQPLPSEVPLRFETDSSNGPTFFGLSCGFEFAAEAVFVWTAPFDGVFRFDTAGSSFDTVLAVMGDVCGGFELGCNDDALGVFSAISTLIPGGQTVTIVVEGKSGEEGPVVLNIHEEEQQPCTFADIGSELGEFVGSTAFTPNLLAGSCGGEGVNEATFLWRAPFPGMFRFETRQTSFDPILYARLGGCDGPEILCSDDVVAAEAGFDLFLTPEDGPLLLVVDGLAPAHVGDFTLAIVPL